MTRALAPSPSAVAGPTVTATVRAASPIGPRPGYLTRPAATPGTSGGMFYRRYAKRSFDVLAVVLAMPVALPAMAIIALLLRLEGGCALYSQRRLGQDGSIFRVWKFRSMVANAEARLEEYLAADPVLRMEWNATQKLKNDPRITRLGRILRKTSLDELPQLFNILRGDMSVVGPRPMMPDQLAIYGPLARHYFALRPGLTGLWQVSDRNKAHFTRRAEIDAEYEGNVTLARDLGIILATFAVVVRGTGY
ncbi:sugar transferase [Roseicitreum antarcticum]|nr:sugar transferase [Roseicitreum antarcticum]